MMVICTLLIALYTFLIGQLIIGFNKVPIFNVVDTVAKTKFSIVVPFRNEAENLPKLIHSFNNLNYKASDFEVILIDDGSDILFEIVDCQIAVRIVKNIRKSNSPKKDAIETAIHVANFDWIVTTDADCTVDENWLKVLDVFIQKYPFEMVVGAVKYQTNGSFLQEFQSLDMASLQGVTMGSFGNENAFMCNGANFAYTKNIFQALDGFAGNNQIASGDDVFLLQKALQQQPEKVGYLKAVEHMVTTNPAETWQQLFYQRVRWASKASAYQTNYPKFLGVITLSANAVFVYLLLSIFFNFQIVALLLLFTKVCIDAILIMRTNRFFKKSTRFLFLSSMVYPFFVLFVGFYSLFGTYDWKGRRF